MISHRNLGFQTFPPLTNAMSLDVPCLQGNGCVPLLREIDCWLTCKALKGSWILATGGSWCGEKMVQFRNTVNQIHDIKTSEANLNIKYQDSGKEPSLPLPSWYKATVHEMVSPRPSLGRCIHLNPSSAPAMYTKVPKRYLHLQSSKAPSHLNKSTGHAAAVMQNGCGRMV